MYVNVCVSVCVNVCMCPCVRVHVLTQMAGEVTEMQVTVRKAGAGDGSFAMTLSSDAGGKMGPEKAQVQQNPPDSNLAAQPGFPGRAGRSVCRPYSLQVLRHDSD